MTIKEQLLREFRNNPVTMITAMGVLIGASAKAVDALSAAQGRRAYSKQVNHSIKKSKK